MTHKTRYNEYNDKFKVALRQGLQLFVVSLQTHRMDSTLKRRGNDRFHVVSTWNPRGVFVGLLFMLKKVLYKQKQKIFLIQITI